MSRALSPPELLPKLALRLAVICVAVGFTLSGVYRLLGKLIEPGWVAALLVNLPLAVLVWKTFRPKLAAPAAAGARPATWARDAIPAGVILLGSALLAAASRLFAPPDLAAAASGARFGLEQLAFIFLVPPIEELVFRGGVGELLRRQGGRVWGSWFSAIVFALAHTAPSLGLPLGPFLLGLLCEALYVRSGRLAPAVLLHAACNATVVIFALGDARWLRWLALLYS